MFSGLKINFRKSRLYGIKNDDAVESWANRISCLVGKLPMTFLGFLFGAKYHPKSMVASGKKVQG